MAQIARYVSQVPLDTDAGGMPRPNFANPGEALEGLGNAVGNALAGGQTQTVDRWVVQCDYGDVTMDLVLGCHACIPQG